MRICLAILCFAATCFAQTTNMPPHTHTREPNEGESITFAYNGHTHDLVVRRYSNKMYMCYVAAITDDERSKVHSDAGMRTLEFRVLGQLSSATKVDMSALDPLNLRMCGHARPNSTMLYYTVP